MVVVFVLTIYSPACGGKLQTIIINDFRLQIRAAYTPAIAGQVQLELGGKRECTPSLSIGQPF